MVGLGLFKQASQICYFGGYPIPKNENKGKEFPFFSKGDQQYKGLCARTLGSSQNALVLLSAPSSDRNGP